MSKYEGLSYSNIGIRVRLGRILKDGRAVIFAFDHGLEHGPSDFPDDRLLAKTILDKVVNSGVDAIMLLPGMARLTHEIWANKVNLVVKLTGKSNIRPPQSHYLQTRLGSVEDAISMGAEAVAATVYWGSDYENDMIQEWYLIKDAADAYGMPVLQLAYPRGSTIKNRYDPEIVMYGARAAAETGADLIKTYYTGSKETFAKVVEIAQGLPVVMSGGAVRDKPIEFLQDVYNVIQAGGSGVAVGRNVFRSNNISGMVRAIMKVVHDNLTPEEAIKELEK
ncbi:MAG: class I fructose-bisphosphate aldolase [Caldisphaera sp.]|nr:class I fructose-bisphosphate aldolase [Caldisphaera sp.]PMP60491.1 MAG: fructose-bisphosphate aldolase [Caldisphaera sp.]PMP90506.1 MAG: fructose-bisphosphate aldolase [Caldisphaera sp.]